MLKIALSVGFACLLCCFALAVNWIAATNGLVSDLSPFWFHEVETLRTDGNETGGTGDVCGSVVHAGGEAISNVRVHLHGDGYTGNPFVYTDINGRFVFTDVPIPGKYHLTVRANGLLFSRPSVIVERAGCENEIRFIADPSGF